MMKGLDKWLKLEKDAFQDSFKLLHQKYESELGSNKVLAENL